ncbi:MAG: hypothetical protein GXO62_02095 [Epsilonproteobacteria bacterium]|nr:hypothetical protein [Campylobacterota bacterium]
MVKDLEELKQKVFHSQEEAKEFLENITTWLLNSSIKDKSISPLRLTYKEFIDNHLKIIFNEVMENLKMLTDLDEHNIKFLAAYLIREDQKNDKVIYKTIAKKIIELLKKDFLVLNHFASDMREVYTTPQGKFIYPVLYPYDSNKYANPLPVIKQELNKIYTTKKLLKHIEEEYEECKRTYEEDKKTVIDLKLALKRIKESIAPHLKNTLPLNEYQQRVWIFNMTKKRFDILLYEAELRIIQNAKKLKALKKNLEGFIQKHQDILNEEEKIIQTIAENLTKLKRKVT